MRAVACVWCVFGAALAAQEPRPPEQPQIVVTGDAVVRRAPDVAFVVFGVESRAKSPREAQQLNATAAAGVLKQLAAAGIARDALRTLGVGLDQEFDTVGGRRVSRGFVARNTIEARIDDVNRAGEIADAGIQGGATSLDGIRFDLKDRAAAERDALRLAVVDARARAEAAAAGAGRAIDRIMKIDDTRAPLVAPRPMIAMRAEAGAATTPVEAGDIEIRASVVLTASMR